MLKSHGNTLYETQKNYSSYNLNTHRGRQTPACQVSSTVFFFHLYKNDSLMLLHDVWVLEVAVICCCQFAKLPSAAKLPSFSGIESDM